jgi:CARDB/FlgD Ig-like domain
MKRQIRWSLAWVSILACAAFFTMMTGLVFPQAKPDLVAQNVTLNKYTVFSGENVTVSFRIANQGNASAGATTTQIRLNQTPMRPIPMTPVLSNVATPALAAGVFIDQSVQVTIPSNTTPGTYYVWILADNYSVLNQNNVDNDFARSAAITVSIPTVVEILQSPFPGDYRLEQNYPNPFNAGTLIRYALPQAGPVVMKIYNAAGQEVRTLRNDFQQPGYHQIYWGGLDEQGQPAPSGFYLYRLEAGSVVLNNKMLMVR